MGYRLLLITKNFGMKINKLLGIIVLGLLLSGNVFAANNLKGIKSFSLIVIHDGKCGGQKFREDLTTSAKYILGNTKINLNKGFVPNDENLRIAILTAASIDTCAGHYALEVFHTNLVENSTGNKFIGTTSFYSDTGVQLSSPVTDHKKHIIKQVELSLKKFVVAWTEDQK